MDYFTCSICDEAFSDFDPHIACSGCGESICYDCAGEQTNKYGKVDPDSEQAAHYGENSLKECEVCTQTIIRDSDIVDFLLNKLNLNIDQVKEEMKDYLNEF